MLASYPPLLPGFHRRRYTDRVELQLLFDDATAAFPALHDSAAPELPNGFQIDAWFLDGFAPAKNPGMWNDELFLQLGRLSRRAPEQHSRTFTVALASSIAACSTPVSCHRENPRLRRQAAADVARRLCLKREQSPPPIPPRRC